MKILKKVLAIALVAAMALVTYVVPVAANGPTQVTAQLYARVEDNGQAIYKVVLDYGNVKVTGVEKDTYTVHVKTTTEGKRPEDETAYGDFDKDREIVKVVENGTTVELYLHENDGAAGTLSYLLNGARNIPSDIEYTVTQNKAVQLSAMDGRDLGEEDDAVITCDNTIIDEETAAFESVKVENGINYQYHKGTNDALIVWFHGNGEGDYIYNGVANGNNVAQMLANRGTVAWTTPEAQAVFGDATVVSFQAPDTWYYAQKDGLLEKAYNEIQDVIKANGIDPEKVYVSGCSAGGYMTTRMLIAYPDLFKAAMINCPALNVADARGGETPTDEELASLKNSKTAIWLVQGETDGTVATDECSKRLFNILTEGQELTTTRVEQEIQSGYTTQETADGKYKLTLYDTTETGKLMFAEDFDQDGVLDYTEFADHWSWIYTLRNNPTDASGTHIWQWAVNYSAVEDTKPVETPTETPATDPNKTATSVKTGDDSAIAVMASIMMLSAGAYVTIKKYAK